MLEINVSKFGGTSIATGKAILQSLKAIALTKQHLIVVSAQSGITNLLTTIQQIAYKKTNFILQIQNIILPILNIIASTKLDIKIKAILADITLLSHMAKRFPTTELFFEILSFGEIISSILTHAFLNYFGINASLFYAKKVIKTIQVLNKIKPNVDLIKKKLKLNYYLF